MGEGRGDEDTIDRANEEWGRRSLAHSCEMGSYINFPFHKIIDTPSLRKGAYIINMPEKTGTLSKEQWISEYKVFTFQRNT